MKAILVILLTIYYGLAPMAGARLSSPNNRASYIEDFRLCAQAALQVLKTAWPECFGATPMTAMDCKALIEREAPVRNPTIEEVIVKAPLGEFHIHIPTDAAGTVKGPVHYWRSENFGEKKKAQWDCKGKTGVECCSMVQITEPRMTCNIDNTTTGQSKGKAIERKKRIYICADHNGLVRKIPVLDFPAFPKPGPMCPHKDFDPVTRNRISQ